MRPYRYAGAPRRRRPISEDELVRDLNKRLPVRAREASRENTSLRLVCGRLRGGSCSAGVRENSRLSCIGWRGHRAACPSTWALGETGEPFEYLLRHLDRLTERLRADAMAAA